MATIPIQSLMENANHYYIYNLNLKLFQMVLWKITREKTWIQICISHLLAMQPWAHSLSNLFSLRFSFIFDEIFIIDMSFLPASQGQS